MARFGIWHGIRDWLRPVDPSTRSRSGTGAIERPFQGSLDTTAEAIVDEADAVSEAELLEFLASDLDPVQADPVFRENLREELWSMVIDQGYARTRES